MTSCNSNYLINVPPLNTVTLSIRFQNMNFGRTLTFQSIVQVMIAPLEGAFTHSLAVVAVDICKVEFKPAATGTQ